MAEEKRLTGSFAQVGDIVWGAEVVGNAADTIPAKTWVQVLAKKSTGSAFGGIPVGGVYYNATNSTIAPPADDIWKEGTFTTMCDVAGVTMNITVDETDTTTLCDEFKKYEPGKQDFDGTAKFQVIRGITDIATTGNLNRFFAITAIDGTTLTNAGVGIVYTPRVTTSAWMLVYLEKPIDSPNDKFDAIMLNINFFSASLPVNQGEAIAYDAKFRLSGSYNPVLFRITDEPV